jgi:hypothetical protein
VLLRIFHGVNSNAKKDIIQYVKWLIADFGILNTMDLEEFIVSYLLQQRVLDAEDQKMKLNLIDMMLEINEFSEKFFIALVFCTTLTCAAVKYKNLI